MDYFESVIKEYTSDFFAVYDLFFSNIVIISIAFILAIALCLILKGLYEQAVVLDLLWAAIVVLSAVFIMYITVISRIGSVVLDNPLENLVYDASFARSHMREIWGNVLLFVPMGAGIAVFVKSRYSIVITIFSGLLFSLCIELLQLFTRCGYFEIYDLLLNVLGTALGCLMRKLVTILSRPEA